MSSTMMRMSAGQVIERGTEHTYAEAVEVRRGFAFVQNNFSVQVMEALGYERVAEVEAEGWEDLMRLDARHILHLADQGLGPLARLNVAQIRTLHAELDAGNADKVYAAAGAFEAAAAPVQGTISSMTADKILGVAGVDLPPVAPVAAAVPAVPHPDNFERANQTDMARGLGAYGPTVGNSEDAILQQHLSQHGATTEALAAHLHPEDVERTLDARDLEADMKKAASAGPGLIGSTEHDTAVLDEAQNIDPQFRAVSPDEIPTADVDGDDGASGEATTDSENGENGDGEDEGVEESVNAEGFRTRTRRRTPSGSVSE